MSKKYMYTGIKSKHPLYQTWSGMKQRCNNPKNPAYAKYGGRGIKVCERWSEFDNFLEDMGEKPTPAHSLDRVDPSMDYRPDNCRWANHTERAVNKSDAVIYTVDGIEMSKGQLASYIGVSRPKLDKMLLSGFMPGEKDERVIAVGDYRMTAKDLVESNNLWDSFFMNKDDWHPAELGMYIRALAEVLRVRTHGHYIYSDLVYATGDVDVMKFFTSLSTQDSPLIKDIHQDMKIAKIWCNK